MRTPDPPQEGRHRVLRLGSPRGPKACSLWATDTASRNPAASVVWPTSITRQRVEDDGDQETHEPAEAPHADFGKILPVAPPELLYLPVIGVRATRSYPAIDRLCRPNTKSRTGPMKNRRATTAHSNCADAASAGLWRSHASTALRPSAIQAPLRKAVVRVASSRIDTCDYYRRSRQTVFGLGVPRPKCGGGSVRNPLDCGAEVEQKPNDDYQQRACETEQNPKSCSCCGHLASRNPAISGRVSSKPYLFFRSKRT